MLCSAVTLSIATIVAIIATILLAAAFATDNWLLYDVNRNNIQMFEAKGPDASNFLKNMNSKYYYYTRTRGLFRICYPKERPPAKTVPTYLSPIDTRCSNIEYFPQKDEDKLFTEDATVRLYLARSCIAAFILSFFVIFIAFWTGLSGCWKRSTRAITATSILFLATCLLASGAMGLWHIMEFFEKEKALSEDFYQQWNTILRDNTDISYGWSYIVAWIGISCCFLTAILLSGATVCLRNEHKKEENFHLQYIMPASSQKQIPYPAYSGYTQSQIYTGPYYNGSQYGSYNF